jgi:hypothetical protein
MWRNTEQSARLFPLTKTGQRMVQVSRGERVAAMNFHPSRFDGVVFTTLWNSAGKVSIQLFGWCSLASKEPQHRYPGLVEKLVYMARRELSFRP